MGCWVYMLCCADGSYYTGHTDNLEQQIAQHHAGEFGGYTTTRRPVKVVFAQECPSREEAFRAERQIKGWSRKKKEALLQGDWEAVNRLSRGKHRHQR
jgi:predicted GIY-YIG superfamily endonuclease